MTVRQCPFCANPLADNTLFCGNCGHVLDNGHTTTISTTRPPMSGPNVNRSTSDNLLYSDGQTPPPRQLSEQELSLIHNYDLSNSPSNEVQVRLSQTATRPLSHQKEREEDDDNIMPIIPIDAGTQQGGAPFVRDVPRAGAAPSVRGTSTIPATVYERHNPYQPQLKRANRGRRGHNRHSAVVVAATGVVALIVAGLLVAHAITSPSSPSKNHASSATAYHPALKLGSNSVLQPGKKVTVLGSGFPANTHVVFSLDGQPLKSGTAAAAQIPSPLLSSATSPAGSVRPGRHPLIDMAPSPDNGILVQADGTFTTEILLPASWGPGPHTILASVPNYQYKVEVNLTIDVQPLGKTPTPGQGTTTSCLGVSSNQLAYTAVTGQGDPASQTITINNCGDKGTWSANIPSNDTSWLAINQTSGTLAGGATVNISVKVSDQGLSAGTYTSKITFKLGISSQSLDVTLSVSSNPCISASPQSLTFSGMTGASDPASQTTTISDCGDAESWSASVATNDGANWLSATPDSNTLSAGGNASITFTASNQSAGLKAGNYTGYVTFTAGTKTTTVTVTFNIANGPCIQSNPSSLTFNGVANTSDPTASQQVTIQNCGDNGDWTASATTTDGATWLSLNMASGSLQNGVSTTVTISASNQKSGLAAGTYTGQITFTITTATGKTSTTTTNVILNVQKPACITASPQTFTVTGVANTTDPAAQKTTLTNCGPDGSWSSSITFDTGSGWLTTNLTNGNLTVTGTQDVNIGISNTSAGLAAGTYTGHITFTISTATSGRNSVTVDVTLTIYNPPCIQSTATQSLTFSGTDQTDPSPTQQAVTYANCGTDTATWTSNIVVDNGSNWLSLDTTNGTINANANQTVNVKAVSVSASLATGTYTGHITFSFTTNGGTVKAIVDVTLTVTQVASVQCALTVSPTSLAFTVPAGGSQTKQLQLSDNCTETWNASADSGAYWLSLDQASGTINAGGTTTVNVTASAPSGYGGGNSTATIQFSTSSNTVTVNVSLSISSSGGIVPSSITSLTGAVLLTDPFYRRDQLVIGEA